MANSARGTIGAPRFPISPSRRIFTIRPIQHTHTYSGFCSRVLIVPSPIRKRVSCESRTSSGIRFVPLTSMQQQNFFSFFFYLNFNRRLYISTTAFLLKTYLSFKVHTKTSFESFSFKTHLTCANQIPPRIVCVLQSFNNSQPGRFVVCDSTFLIFACLRERSLIFIFFAAFISQYLMFGLNRSSSNALISRDYCRFVIIYFDKNPRPTSSETNCK